MRSPESELADLAERSLLRSLRPFDSPQGTTVVKGGKTLVNFASNDYLGLAGSGRLKGAFVEAVERFGTGSGASRMLGGSLPPHTELEEKLAAFKGTEAALTFSTGYATAVGTITALAHKGDVIILDKLCHACLIDGARLSGATLRIFPHNRIDRLAQHLQWARSKVSPKGRILVATESVFSMDGDQAPLKDIVSLAKENGALVLVDEAHAFGVLGPGGRGLAAELGIADAIDLHMGTLSKAAGVAGGYLCCRKALADTVLNCARSFIYSTAPPPAQAAAASAAIEVIGAEEGQQLRTRLRENVARFKTANAFTSAIVPVPIGDEERALSTASQLEESGIFAPAVRYPTVARGSARLRLTFSAAHSTEQVDSLRSILAAKGTPL